MIIRFQQSIHHFICFQPRLSTPSFTQKMLQKQKNRFIGRHTVADIKKLGEENIEVLLTNNNNYFPRSIKFQP